MVNEPLTTGMQRLKVKGWERALLAPYRLTSLMRHRLDRFLKKIFTQWIRLAFDAPNTWFRGFFLGTTTALWRWSHFFLRQLELDVYLMQGESTIGEGGIRVVYVGDKLRYRYLINRLFVNGEATQEGHWRVPFWQLAGLGEALESLWADLVIFELPEVVRKVYKGKIDAESPDSLQMIFAFRPGEDEEQIVGRMKSQKEAFRRFRKAGYRIVEGDSTRDFSFFYERMHVPYIKGRHGGYADIGSPDVMYQLCKQARLRFVCLPDGTRIAGTLSMMSGKVYHGLFMGILDGDWNHVRNGAAGFIYYQEILSAYREGARLFDGGEVMPFEGDGVFQHKHLWGFEPIENPWHTNHLFFWTPNGSEVARQWLVTYRPIAKVRPAHIC